MAKPSSRSAYALAIGLLGLLGCSTQVASSSIASSQASFDEAKQLCMSGQYESGLPLIEQAILGGGLGPDQYAEALLLRTLCYAHAGELEKAQADLAEAQMGDPDEAFLHLTKGFVLSKEGKDAEAKKEFAIAKRLNPEMKLP